LRQRGGAVNRQQVINLLDKIVWAICVLLIALSILVLFSQLSGCATEPPRQIIKPEVVTVTKEVRVPIPRQYLQPIVVTEPAPLFPNLFSNKQAADLLDDYRGAVNTCNARFDALRNLNPTQP
jgi:hypothetical protein